MSKRADKFRIIKKESINGLGEYSSYCLIQKKFLFWWFNYKIERVFSESVDYNESPSHVALVTGRIIRFDTQDWAKKNLDKIVNPFRERYKGNLIERLFLDHKMTDVFINHSYCRYGSRFGPYYEYAHSLEHLKKIIDERTIETKTTVV